MTEQEVKSLTEKINKLAWVNRALEYQINLNKKSNCRGKQADK